MITNVILPSCRSYEDNTSKLPTIDYHIIDKFYKEGIVSFAPAGHDDDLFTLGFAEQYNALILSNDKYSNHTSSKEFKHCSKKFAIKKFFFPSKFSLNKNLI